MASLTETIHTLEFLLSEANGQRSRENGTTSAAVTAGAVLEAAALSFIGLGAQPPTPEWGAILSEGRNYVFTSPHLVFFPGIAIMITVLGFNLVGDGLRDALDPRLNKT